MDKDSKGQKVGEMTLWGNRERYGQGQQRTEKVGEMTLWGNRERYGQGQQRTEKDGGCGGGLLPTVEGHSLE